MSLCVWAMRQRPPRKTAYVAVQPPWASSNRRRLPCNRRCVPCNRRAGGTGRWGVFSFAIGGRRKVCVWEGGGAPDRGRSNTDTQNVGATPGGTRASIADNEEGHSKAGEATRTVGTGNQNGGDGRACAWEAATTKGDGLASQPRRYWVPGQPLLHRHQVGGVSRSPDGLFAQQEREPIRGRPTVRGKRTYGGRPGQRVEEQGTWASRTQKHSEAGHRRPVDRGAWTAKTVKRPRQQPAHPQYANYWAPLTRKRHPLPHSAQPQHTNHWAPRTRKRHQREHRPQPPTERSDPTQHAKGRTGDRLGPRKGATTRRNVTRGGGVRAPRRRGQGGGGSGKGALMTGQSQEMSLKTLTMPHPLRPQADGGLVLFQRAFPRGTSLKTIGASRVITLSHMCLGYPPTPRPFLRLRSAQRCGGVLRGLEFFLLRTAPRDH